MRPYIARRAIRRLLASDPPFSRSCRHPTSHTPPHVLQLPRYTRVERRNVSARSFMQLFEDQPDGESQPRRHIASPKFDPGMEKMLDLTKRISQAVRLPLQEELVKAFNALVHSKTKYSRPINDFHAGPMFETLRVLEKRHDPDTSPSLDRDAINAAFRALATFPSTGYTKSHRKLARALAEALKRRNKSEHAPPPRTLIIILASVGRSIEARELLESYTINNPDHVQNPGPWVSVLAGFSQRQQNEEFRKTIERMGELGIKFNSSAIRTIAVHYAQSDNVLEAKKWFSQVDFGKNYNASEGSHLTDDDYVYRTLLEFCLRNSEMEFGNSILQTAEGKSSPFNKWEAIFKASAATGRTVEEMDRMLAIMDRHASETHQQELRPDVNVFNGIIGYAISQKAPYMAERYFGLMNKWKAEPNALTYLLQVEYRLQADDVNGALASYNRIDQTTGQDFNKKEALPVFNQLLRQATVAPRISHDTIMGLVNDILDPEIVLPAPTILALTKYHLHRDEYFNLVDLLQTYSYQYSTSERLQIRDMLLKFTLDTNNDVGRAWDTYMVWHQVFDIETTREPRQAAMESFFARRRPDLATHVFTRMARHDRKDTRPTVDTYVAAFEGIGFTQEPDALEVVHNLLKLDTDVEPCTRLLNGLMLAYASCGMPSRALAFWRDIAMSAEGPSHNSLSIVMRACEKAVDGRRIAGNVWSQLHEADVEIDTRLFSNWLCVLAAQGMYEEMFAELSKMKDATGDDPDLLTIASLYNTVPGMSGQSDLKKWFLDKHPHLIAELEAFHKEHGDAPDKWSVPRINNVVRPFPA